MNALHHSRPRRPDVEFKIVYCGPPEGGKTTNLRYVHRRLDPAFRGELVSIATERERTLYFDYLPVKPSIVAGCATKFQLYTVPGQEVLREARRTVLEGAHGVVFVADSSPRRFEASLRAFEDLRENLRANGVDPESFPVVFQYNKRDLPGAVPPEDFDEAFGVRSAAFTACAATGYQVFATLDRITQKLLKEFHAPFVLPSPAPASAAPRPVRSAGACDAVAGL